MKMITAVVNKRDTDLVCDALRSQQVPFTKVSTSGGFLRAGNATLLIGVDDERVSSVIEIIRTHCSQRMGAVPYVPAKGAAAPPLPSVAHVLVGGATIFVTNVERFERL